MLLAFNMQATNTTNGTPVSIAGINYYHGHSSGIGQANRRQRFGPAPNVAVIDTGTVAVNLNFAATSDQPVVASGAGDSPPVIATVPAVNQQLATTPANGDHAATSDGQPAPIAVPGEEVNKMVISAPKLNIPADIKLADLGRVVAPCARAFVRNVRKYFGSVRGGHQDYMRCLYLANAFDGAAKIWHDQWTDARENYTSEELLTALLARFAPQIQPRGVEARHKLSAGSYLSLIHI